MHVHSNYPLLNHSCETLALFFSANKIDHRKTGIYLPGLRFSDNENFKSFQYLKITVLTNPGQE